MAGFALGIILGVVTYFTLLEHVGVVLAVILGIVVFALEAGTPYFPTRRP